MILSGVQSSNSFLNESLFSVCHGLILEQAEDVIYTMEKILTCGALFSWGYGTPKISLSLSGMYETMTRRRFFNAVFEPLLSLYGEAEARAIAFRVCERIGGFSRLDMAVAPEVEAVYPAGVEGQAVERMIGELAEGRPVQYVLGTAPFFGREFRVGEGVLIPRPETEELVRWIVSDCRSVRPLRLLDIGTGSGCIALSLASELAGAEVSGMDVSARALAFARENAALLELPVDWFRGDVLDDTDPVWHTGKRWEVIVSNPPYVPDSDRQAMHVNVRDHEPSEALFVPDDDPLRFYRAIARRGRETLVEGVLLYFEIYEGLAAETVRLLEQEGYGEVELRVDMNDKSRMIRCRKR